MAREVLDCLLKFDTVDLFAKDYGGDMAVDMFKTGYIHRTLKSRMAEIQKGNVRGFNQYFLEGGE